MFPYNGSPGSGNGGGGTSLATPVSIANGGTGAGDASTARTNLGLGTAATKAFGTGANQLVELNGSGQLPAVDGSLLTGIVDMFGWSHQVNSHDGLVSALGVPGARILITGSFTLTGDIAISTGSYIIGRKSGCTISTSTYGFTCTTSFGNGANLYFIDPYLSGSARFFNMGGSATLFQSTPQMRLYGEISISSGANTPFGVNCNANFKTLVIDCGVGTAINTLGRIEKVMAFPTSSSDFIEVTGSFGHIDMIGVWRAYNFFGIHSAYTIHLKDSTSTYKATKVDEIRFSVDSTAYYPGVKVGEKSSLGTVSSGNDSYPPYVGVYGNMYAGQSTARLVINEYTSTGKVYDLRIDGKMTEGAYMAPQMIDCRSTVALSFESGTKPRFVNFSVINGGLTFESGSKPDVKGLYIETSQSVTINSGAQAVVTGLKLNSSATFTNNDPLTIVTGSETPLYDTTPHTARFLSTVLDPLIGRLCFYYPGTTEGESNKAPIQRSSGVLGQQTSSGASMNSGYYISSTTGQFSARINWGSPSRLGWTLAFFWRPTSVSFGGAEQNILSLYTPSADFIAVNQIDNNLRFYQGGSYYETSTAGNLFSTSTARLVAISARVNSGSLDLFVRVNGTQVFTVAGIPLTAHDFNKLVLGSNGTDARLGRFTHLQGWDLGMSNAQMDELLTKTLLTALVA